MVIELKSTARPGSPISYETLLQDVNEGREYTGKGELLEKYKPKPKEIKQLMAPESKSFWGKLKKRIKGGK